MQLQDIIDAWNAEADEYNQWQALSSDEMTEFAIEYVQNRCAEICVEVGVDGAGMAGETWCDRCADAINAA